MHVSSVIANIFLSIASLIFGVIVVGFYLRKTSTGGDAAIGNAYALFFGILVFFVSIALAAAAIGWKGGFHWVAANGFSRFALVAMGVLAIGLIGFISEEGPRTLMPIAKILPLVVPLAAIAGGFCLANDQLAGGLPAPTGRWLMLLSFWGSMVLPGIMIVKSLAQMGIAIGVTSTSQSDPFQENVLAEIDSWDTSKSMVSLLIHSGENRVKIVREPALAKIKTHPDWQGEIARILDSEDAEYAFTFLASNEVLDKSLFPEAVQKGVLHRAKFVRERVRNYRNLTADYYKSEVRQVLQSVEKMEGMGVDLLPAVRKLRAAFGEPSDFDHPKFKAAAAIDKWLKKRE